LPADEDQAKRTHGFDDPLAAALWRARAGNEPLDRAAWPDVDLARGKAVGAELYARLDQLGIPRIGAKAAVTDAGSQAVFGASGPLVVPIFENVAIADGATVFMADFTTPFVEAEIGVRVTEDGMTLMPCIEIADLRFFGGPPAIAYLAADFGAQGGMIFGEPGDAEGQVAVTVTVDGQEVNRAERSVDDALRILELVRSELDLRSGDGVATGSFFTPMPLTVGAWAADFGDLGRITFTVT
jgi:2-keto-4-pentenoate hydratase